MPTLLLLHTDPFHTEANKSHTEQHGRKYRRGRVMQETQGAAAKEFPAASAGFCAQIFSHTCAYYP